MTTRSPAPARRGARALRGALAVLLTLAAVALPAPAFAATDAGATATTASLVANAEHPAAGHRTTTLTLAEPPTALTTAKHTTTTPSPSPEPTPTPSLEIAASGWGVLAGTQPFTLSARVVNAAASAPSDVSFTASVEPLASAEAVAAWLDRSDQHTATPRAVATLPSSAQPSTATPSTTPPTPTPDERTGSVVVDPVAAGLDKLPPGVYPLAATAGALTARSVLVVENPSPAPVATIVPITAPPLTSALLSIDELAALTAPGGSLRAQVDAVTGTPAILAIDPAIVAAIRLHGAEAPASATTWLADLLALPNQRFALQFGDADLAAQVAAGLTEPLDLTTLAPLASGQPSGNATDAPDDSADLSLEALLDIGAAQPGVYWPATGTGGATVVAVLGATQPGTTEPDTTDTVATPVTLSSVTEPVTEPAGGPLVAVPNARALAYDALLAAALRDVSTTASLVARNAAHAAVSAYATFAAPHRPLVAVVDRAAVRDPLGIREAVAHAAALGGRSATTLSALLAEPPTDAAIADTAPEQARADALNLLRDDEKRLTDFATLLEDPAVLTGPERARILQLLGNAWRADNSWADAVASHRNTSAKTLASVHLVPSSDIVLLGTNTSLVFTVRNDLPWPVSLTALARPSDPRLVVQKRTEVTAGAAQNTRIEIPVEARVARGEVVLGLRLVSPAMVDIGDPVSVQVSVRAEWEGVGVAVMAVGVGALLVMGAVRTVRRLRGRRHAGASDTEATADPPASTPQAEDTATPESPKAFDA